MQALLSYDQSPPLAAPLRFFVTAPLFAVIAGFVLLWGGPDLFASRWTPAALSATHLITAGFMLQVMLGAMLQILPVVAGANIARTKFVAALVHDTITIGALALGAAFVNFAPELFIIAAVAFTLGCGLFIAAAGRALAGIAATNPIISGLKLSLGGLLVTIGLGVLLVASLAGASFELPLPLLQLAGVHLAWGFVGWGVVLLAAVAGVVVPMFQMTPPYPDWFSRPYAAVAILVLAVWTLGEFFVDEAQAWSAGGVIIIAAVFAAVTLAVQRRSKRARFDVTQHYWRVAMASALAACALWLAAQLVPEFGDWPGWPFLFGVLVIVGGFMSVIVGMLYKIVPFLIWLNLQNEGKGRLMAPNMKKIISEKAMHGQMLAHFFACALLLLAVVWPLIIYPAALALIGANAWLACNLLAALGVYRAHLNKIAALGCITTGNEA